jgi:hypothetical protein
VQVFVFGLPSPLIYLHKTELRLKYLLSYHSKGPKFELGLSLRSNIKINKFIKNRTVPLMLCPQPT